MITTKQAEAIRPGARAIPSGVTGLSLKPTAAKGKGRWVLRFVSPVTGKRRDMSLGTFPDLTVQKALKAGRAAREELAAGLDPIQQRHERNQIPTFEQLARERWEQLCPGFTNARHRQNWIRGLELYAFPRIGDARVDHLTPKHFADMLRPIWVTRADLSIRIRQRCIDVMDSAWALELIERNPVPGCDRLLPKHSIPQAPLPAMPWQTVPAYVNAELMRRPRVGARAALLFAILTAARSGEVRGATWDEFDLEVGQWVVPAWRMKMDKAHRVPLAAPVVDLLVEQWPDGVPPGRALVFRSVRGKHMSDMAMTSLLRKTHAPSDTADRAATAHGFRASFRTWASDHGYAYDLAERALAHKIPSKTQRVYERTDLLERRVPMMEAWAAHVLSGVGENVVAIRKQHG